MKQEKMLMHEFVEYIPNDLKDGTIYVSMSFATVTHKCCCGCREKVVTPLSPTDWKLIFDGESISLDPSIGNWSFNCKSHYWIRRNRVMWAQQWSQEEINAGRAYDRQAKERYFKTADILASDTTKKNSGQSRDSKPAHGFWQKMKNWWSQW